MKKAKPQFAKKKLVTRKLKVEWSLGPQDLDPGLGLRFKTRVSAVAMGPLVVGLKKSVLRYRALCLKKGRGREWSTALKELMDAAANFYRHLTNMAQEAVLLLLDRGVPTSHEGREELMGLVKAYLMLNRGDQFMSLRLARLHLRQMPGDKLMDDMERMLLGGKDPHHIVQPTKRKVARK